MKVREMIEELKKHNPELEITNDVNEGQVIDDVYVEDTGEHPALFITFKDPEE